MFGHVRAVIIAVLLVVLGSVIGYRYGQTGSFPFGFTQVNGQIVKSDNPARYKNVTMDTFWEVWGELEKEYLRTEKLDPETMVDGAISGMTAALGDPYTTYLPPETNEKVAQDIAGAFYGVGIELGYKDNTLAVVAPLQGSPAERAGVQAGDLILHVSDPTKNLDSDTGGWSLQEAVDNIRGPSGSTVTLTIFRQGENQPRTIDLTREEIVVKTVTLEFVEPAGKKIAVIKLSRFGERTQTEWNAAVAQILATPNVSGIILDMRNNPGGLFDESIDIASDFVPSGIIVKQKGKFTTQDFKAKGNARLSRFPVAVLVNKGSASASEIVAGALRDDINAKLYGETTFGKGTVQDRKDLSNGGGLHITIAEWLMPKGESIHEKGIGVNVEVTDNPDTPEDEVVQRAVQDF